MKGLTHLREDQLQITDMFSCLCITPTVLMNEARQSSRYVKP